VFSLFDGWGDDPPASSAVHRGRMLSNEDKTSPLEFASGRGDNQQRQLKAVPQACYSNMITNGNFESGLDKWQRGGTVKDMDTIPRDDGLEGSVLRFQNRYCSNDGVKQGLDDSYFGCFSGSGFYFRVTADIRLYDKDGAGVTCRNDRFHAYMRNCPRLQMWTRKWDSNTADDTTNFEIHDANMEWNAEGWNKFDVIFQVPERMSVSEEKDMRYSSIRWKGARVTDNYQLGNVVLTRLEAADLPIGHPIWDSDPVDCTDNLLQNGDGEYQSPYGWQSFGHWHADFNITVEGHGSGSGPEDDGYALLALDRTRPEKQGFGQWIYAQKAPCFSGVNYYFRIEADVQLYDQTTKAGVTSCSALSHLNCPSTHITVRRLGQRNERNTFYDHDIINAWNPDGWNHIDMIIAMHPVSSDPAIDSVRVVFDGGPANSVLKLDNARVRRITYKQIPNGHAIFALGDGAIKLMSAVKVCRSTGDPHFTTFGGAKFNFHELGWNLLYEKGALKVEALHEKFFPDSKTSTIASNGAVKVTYRGKVYDFVDGKTPKEDSYFKFDTLSLTFPYDEDAPDDPAAKVTVTSRYVFRGLYIHNIFVTTSATTGAKGLCADKSDKELAAIVAVDPVVTFNDELITEEEAGQECQDLQGTEAFEDCVFDLRMATATIAETEYDPAEGTPQELARSLVRASSDFIDVKQTLEVVAEEEARQEIIAPVQGTEDAGVNGDPTVIGLNHQVFDFEGRDNAWYANLATNKLQWNMKYNHFPLCPEHEDMFVTGLGVLLDLSARHTNLLQENRQQEIDRTSNRIHIRVKGDTFMKGCTTKDPCLGEGNLEILVDGESITAPGEYVFGPDGSIRVVAHNTFASCSRKWYDYADKNSATDSDTRSLSMTSPIKMLFDAEGKVADWKDCKHWILSRQQYGDIYRQLGAWSTIHIETPLVNFHVEFHQHDGSHKGCPHHSIDAWMSEVSLDMKSDEWRGILGETRDPIFNQGTGEQIVSGRNMLLQGKHDQDYEVTGPYGTTFGARRNLIKKVNPSI